MQKYKIANLIVGMNIYYDKLKNQAKKYIIDTDKECDIKINLSEDYFKQIQKENNYLSLEDAEYIFTGAYFYDKIIDFDGFLLHSSAICMDNNAYLFSAPSGTGKSTHTNNWIKYFGKDKITYINDDKPVIRLIGDDFYCCGTPFSGKTDLSNNIQIKIKAIIFIKRGNINSCRVLENKDAINKIFEQTLASINKNRAYNLLSLLDKLLKKIKIYELTCNMNVESAKICYDFINKGEQDGI